MLVKYTGHDVDSIGRKYTSIQRKKVPIVNPNMLEEVRLAKNIKYMMGDRMNLGGEEEDEYDMMSDRFDGREKYAETPGPLHIPPVVNITVDVKEGSLTCNSSRQIFGLNVKRSKKADKPDIMTIMMM